METVVVVAARKVPSSFSLTVPGIADGDYVDLVSGQHASLRAGLTNLSLAPFSVALFVPSGSVCAKLVTP